MSVTTKTRRRMPWRKVGHDIYTDDVARELLALPDGIGAAALALRVLLEVRSVLDETHLVVGSPAQGVGWLLTEAGRAVTVGALAGTTGFSVAIISAALEQLVGVGVAVRSDAGAWGTLGWAGRQEDESAERKRQQRERERDGGRTSLDKSVTSRGHSGETVEEDREGEEKTKDREPEPRAASAQLVTALAALHPPSVDPSQRWKPKNRAHLEAAEALLALDSDLGWFDEVIDIVTDFSAICSKNREEAKFWLAPRMLDLVPSPRSVSGKSRWETIKSVVASWRVEQRAQAEEAQRQREVGLAAERQRVADRLAELESLARNGEPAFARQLRESGQRSTPVVDYKACLSAAQEAVADARRGGRDPTLEEIERAVRAVQEKP